MGENQREIQRQYRTQQEKYVYYIVALSVSAIGFSLYKTSGQPLKWSQISLGLAIISWGLSIFCGLTFIKEIIGTLSVNNAYLDIQAGRHPDIGDNPIKVAAGVDSIKRIIEKKSKGAGKFYRWQGRLFYLGILLFIVWHVSEMYILTTVTPCK